jgi:RHS repeat-associated protein
VGSDNIHFDQDSTWANVVNVTDYYPFGLGMDGRTEQDSAYRYGFNGKEFDGDGEWGGQSNYDYGFRIYNPNIAKFLSVDPLTKKYPELTPYQFASNTPIQAIDLDGLEAVRYPGVGTTTEMLQKPTDQEVKEVYQAYRGIALGVYDFFSSFRPQNSIGSLGPNYIPVYSEAKDAYKKVNETFEDGSIEDKWRLGTIGALSIYGGTKALSKPKVSSELGAPKTGGRLGSASTRTQIGEIATELESRGYTITRGGGRFPEEYLKPKGGGRKGGRI